MRLPGLLFVALWFALLAAGVAQTSGGPAAFEQIKESIAKARSDKSLDGRTEAAAHVATLTKRISSKEVTEGLVTDLISLLDSPDDSVRYW